MKTEGVAPEIIVGVKILESIVRPVAVTLRMV